MKKRIACATTFLAALGLSSLVHASSANVEAALKAYEQVRVQLTADNAPEAAKAAKTLAERAEAASKDAPQAQRSHLTSMAGDAKTLHASSDLNEQRKAFSGISRAAVALLENDESLRGDLHVFQCPMWDGFNKWVQADKELTNPYMGQKMLACGSAVDGKKADHKHHH